MRTGSFRLQLANSDQLAVSVKSPTSGTGERQQSRIDGVTAGGIAGTKL